MKGLLQSNREYILLKAKFGFSRTLPGLKQNNCCSIFDCMHSTWREYMHVYPIGKFLSDAIIWKFIVWFWEFSVTCFTKPTLVMSLSFQVPTKASIKTRMSSISHMNNICMCLQLANNEWHLAMFCLDSSFNFLHGLLHFGKYINTFYMLSGIFTEITADNRNPGN